MKITITFLGCVWIEGLGGEGRGGLTFFFEGGGTHFYFLNYKQYKIFF